MRPQRTLKKIRKCKPKAQRNQPQNPRKKADRKLSLQWNWILQSKKTKIQNELSREASWVGDKEDRRQEIKHTPLLPMRLFSSKP